MGARFRPRPQYRCDVPDAAGRVPSASAFWVLCPLLNRRPGRFILLSSPAETMTCRASSLAKSEPCFCRWKPSQNHGDFDRAVCVLLDIDLGDGLGIDLRHSLKAIWISVPVIYMTGNDNSAVRTAALQSGCIAYLTKPASAKSLSELLKKLAAGARAR